MRNGRCVPILLLHALFALCLVCAPAMAIDAPAELTNAVQDDGGEAAGEEGGVFAGLDNFMGVVNGKMAAVFFYDLNFPIASTKLPLLQCFCHCLSMPTSLLPCFVCCYLSFDPINEICRLFD